MDTGSAPAARPHGSPLRTNTKMRLCAVVSAEDCSSSRLSLPLPNQIAVAGALKSHSKNAFDNVFGPETSQDDICSSILPELLHSLFNGNDSSLVALGAKSKCKESFLYGSCPSSPGLLHTAVESLFRMIEECRSKRPDSRLQLRLSAVHYSQRENSLTDLLSTFNSDPRRRVVRVSEDVRSGAVELENESAIRVDSLDQALFYLSTVADHRLVEDDESFRTNHVFIFFTLYGYRTNGQELEGGRHRFVIADLGIGERNSQRGELTMPALGGILMAIYQGQKQLPSREHVLSQLLRCVLCPSRLSTLSCSFSAKTDDNENVVQLASKLARIKRGRNNVNKTSSSDTSSSVRRSDLESGSEVSAAETAIYVGPRPLHRAAALPPPPRSPSCSSKATTTHTSGGSSTQTCTWSVPPMLKGHTPFLSAPLRLYDDLCSPPGTSYDVSKVFGGKCTEKRDDFGITIATPKKSKSKNNLNDEKHQAIVEWMESCEPILVEVEDKEIARECVILSHPLEDIIEMDEESLRESLRSLRDSHPLRNLSNEKLEVEKSTERTNATDCEEDALERAMEASVSSIKSHDILAKLKNCDNAPKDISNSATTGTPSEMDMYRRASQLEEYATQRMKELDDERLRKKKGKLMLNCCQNSMVSSSSTVVDWSQVEKRRVLEQEKEEEERRRLELRTRRDQLKVEEGELRKERREISKVLDDRPYMPSTLMRQITHQLHSLSIGGKPVVKARMGSDSLPSTPSISHRKIVPVCRTPSLTNCSAMMSPLQPSISSQLGNKLPRSTKDLGSHSRKTSKSRSDKKERRSSDSKDEGIVSPYAKVTDPRLGPAGPASSGRGSDSAGTDTCGRRKRQSYSASSGYESGNGEYHTYNKDSRLQRLRCVDRRLTLGVEAENLRETQRRLSSELHQAKARIGQVDDARSICHDSSSRGITQATLVDTLIQENRILEKRLIACQNHTMLVTSFL